MTIQVDGRHERSVAIHDIHSGLAEEWAKLSAEVEESTGQPPLRTSTLTLAIIATTESDASALRQTLHQLATAVPSRVILFKLFTNVSDVSAQVWAHCAMTPSGRPGHCYDVIEIDIPAAERNAVPNIIAAHRLGELPTFVFCYGEFDILSDTFKRVAVAADRIIIDSEGFDSHLSALRDYAYYLGTSGVSCAGSDLAWTRISTWRELIAQSFDSPATSKLLPAMTRIDISFDASSEGGALLLASWLLSRLGYEPVKISQGSATTTMVAHSSQHDRRLIVNLDKSQGTGLGIRTVRIQAQSASEATRITIRKQREARTSVSIDTTGMPRQERVVQHPTPDVQELVGAELMRFKRDRIYEEAIALAAAFARKSLDAENAS